jgi:hypothetical protein
MITTQSHYIQDTFENVYLRSTRQKRQTTRRKRMRCPTTGRAPGLGARAADLLAARRCPAGWRWRRRCRSVFRRCCSVRLPSPSPRPQRRPSRASRPYLCLPHTVPQTLSRRPAASPASCLHAARCISSSSSQHAAWRVSSSSSRVMPTRVSSPCLTALD